MPQVQILQAQQDPGAQAMQSAGQTISDSIYKSQQLKMLQMDNAIKSKMAQTDQDKAKTDRTNVMLTSMQKAFDQGVFKNEKLSKAWMKMMGDNFGSEFFDFLQNSGDSLQGFQSPAAELQTQQAADYKSQADTRQAELLDPGAGLRGVMSAFKAQGTGAPVGTIYAHKMPDGSTINIPFNPDITGTEADTIAKASGLQAVKDQLYKFLDEGNFGSDTKPIKRTINQARVEDPNALMTAGNQSLGDFRGLYNVIRQAALFDEAGKALTGSEKVEQLRLLQLVGKTDAQIKKDLSGLIEKNWRKMQVIMGGTSAAQGMMSPQTGSTNAYKLLNVR